MAGPGCKGVRCGGCGAPVGADGCSCQDTWRMSERQPDAVVTDGQHVGRCGGTGDTVEEQQRDELEFYGGHFVCESVNPAYRPPILALPKLLAAARFSLSVHRAQGLIDLSEQMAAEKLEAAIAAAEGRA